MIVYYDKSNKPITKERWEELNANDAYRQVAYDETTVKGVIVSTIWLGNTLEPFSRRPMIFETRILQDDQQVHRFMAHTLTLALIQHRRAIEMVIDMFPP